MMNPYPASYSILVMDNTRIYYSPKVTALVKSYNMYANIFAIQQVSSLAGC
jgi:hypothetical protein